MAAARDDPHGTRNDHEHRASAALSSCADVGSVARCMPGSQRQATSLRRERHSRQACWSSAVHGHWRPDPQPQQSYTITNDAGGWRAKALPREKRSWEQYAWQPLAGSQLNVAPVSRERWCNVMQQQGIRRLAIVGDSISWSMIQSLWKLLELGTGPPPRRPTTRLLQVDCGRGQGIVELLWVSSNHLNASITADAVRNADVTLLNAGPWYSSANAAMRERFVSVQSDRLADAGRIAGRGFGARNGVSMSSAWRLFVDDLLDVHRVLRDRGLPDASHRLVWRTSHTGHPGCNNYTRPLTSPGDALAGLLACRECVEDWGWHLYPALDRAARDRLGNLGALAFDVRPMTALRPDAHTQHSYAPGKYDCLHLALPGVPDWWSALFLSIMESCGV